MNHLMVKVEPLTAVHIGTGESLDPMAYVIKGDYLLRYKPESILRHLPADKKDQFFELVERNEHFKVASLLHAHLNETQVLYSIPVTPSVGQKYHASIGTGVNQLLIEETYKEAGTHVPVIPGSSIKGAIRTALADQLAQKKQPQVPKTWEIENFEKQLFDNADANSDPLRSTRISDCCVAGSRALNVSDFVNFKENRAKSQDFSQMSLMKEHIIGPLCDGDATGYCQFSIDNSLQSINQAVDKWQPLNFKVELQTVITACNQFYMRNLEQEYNKFYANSKYRELKINSDKLMRLVQQINPKNNECLIRLGRFSQVENVTLGDPYRKPTSPKGFGSTRTLTESLMPVGFVKLTFLSFADYRAAQAQQQSALRLAAEKKQKADQEMLANQARLDNMSPAEKMLERIQMLKSDPNEIALVISTCFEQDFPAEVFMLLKARLQTLGQWSPAGSKKRKQKMTERNRKIVEKINQ